MPESTGRTEEDATVDRPLILAFGLVAAVFLVDLSLPLGVAAAVPYTFAVLAAFASRRSRFAFVVAALCVVLTLLKLYLVPERGNTEMWKVLVNRGLAVFAVCMTTFLGYRRRQADGRRRRAEGQVMEQWQLLTVIDRRQTAGQLAAGLAHELNQPLTAVCLQAEILEQLLANDPNRERLQPLLTAILEQSRRAAEIVRGLRRMLRPGDVAFRRFDLLEALGTVLVLLGSELRRFAVVVQLPPPEPAWVVGDRVQIEQVLMNGVQNAIDSLSRTQAGTRTIRILLVPNADGGMVLHIQDNGPGPAADGTNRLFDHFYTTKPQGLGLGLAISRVVMENHGGTISAAPAMPHGMILSLSFPPDRSTP